MTQLRTILSTVPDMIGEDDLVNLRTRSHLDYREFNRIEEADLADLCNGYDYLMLNYDVVKELSPGFYRREQVQSLRAISVDITGMDWASPEAASEAGVKLLNIPHYSTESVAETTLSEVLLHSRQRHLAYMDEIHGRPVEARKGINLQGRTAGVVGLGSIGTRVAELLSAVGMKVVAWNRTPRAVAYESVSSLEHLFNISDVICLCVKTVREGTEQNVNFVDDKLLSHCNSSIIVNLANRDLVDHEALTNHLQGGSVAAYSVEYSQSLKDSALGQLDQVHFPPSNSWLSDESLSTLRHVWVQNIIDAMDEDYPNLVSV